MAFYPCLGLVFTPEIVLKLFLTLPIGKSRFTGHETREMGGITMVIRQSQGPRQLSQIVGKREIRKINDANPAIRATIDALVANSTEATLSKKREVAIFGVYQNNRIYKTAIDDKLSTVT